MKLLFYLVFAFVHLLVGVTRAEQAAPFELIIAVGAGGAPEYEQSFREWGERWQKLGEITKADTTIIGLSPKSETSDLDQFKTVITAKKTKTDTALVIVLIGHGTHLQQSSKFNLRGPDLSDQEMAAWLKDTTRPIAIVQTASASGPFLKSLASADRIVITATRSGNEQNYARFGDFFSNALTNSEADLDHDDAISMLEAFLFASNRVARFYDQESRLATEHSLLDDNGDGLGTPANFFRGIRAVKAAKDNVPLDGMRSHQVILFQLPGHVSLPESVRVQRDALERQINQLRLQKGKLGEEAYYLALEPLMLQLARLYHPAKADASDSDDASAEQSTPPETVENDTQPPEDS